MLVVVKGWFFFDGNVFFSCTLFVFREGEGNGVIPLSKKTQKKKLLLLPFLFSHLYEGKKRPPEEWVFVWMSEEWNPKPAARFSNLIQARRMCKNGCFWCCLLAEIRQPLIFQGNGSVCFNFLQERKSAWDSATQNKKTRTCGILCALIKANADWLPPSILSISLLALGCSLWKSCALGGQLTVPVPDVLSFRGLLPFSL